MSRELCAAASASEAVIMRDDSSAYLAGGTELLRSGTERSADRLIMLKNIPELKGVSGETPEAVRIGSMTTFQEALGSDLVPAYLKEALRYMASRTKRDMATIGGNVALMRDDSYLAATLIAAHAKLELLRRTKPDSGESEQDQSGYPDKNSLDLEEASQARGDQPVRETICIRRYLQHRKEYQPAGTRGHLHPALSAAPGGIPERPDHGDYGQNRYLRCLKAVCKHSREPLLSDGSDGICGRSFQSGRLCKECLTALERMRMQRHLRTLPKAGRG